MPEILVIKMLDDNAGTCLMMWLVGKEKEGVGEGKGYKGGRRPGSNNVGHARLSPIHAAPHPGHP